MRRRRGLPDDRDHRRVIHLRIVKPVEQMNRSRTRTSPGRCPTSPVNLACAHAMNAAISSCRTCTNRSLSPMPVERTHDAVDAVARIAVNAIESPLD